MANLYKTQGCNKHNRSYNYLYSTAGRTTIVKNIQISNEHASNNLVEVSVTDSSASATFEVYHKDLSSGETVNAALSPIVLESADILKIQVGTVDTIEGMVSYLEIFDEKSS